MDRYWFLTNTCYGNWLPGDARGFVSHVREHRPGEFPTDHRVTHNHSGSPYDTEMQGLRNNAQRLLKGPPISLTRVHAELPLAQFQETASFRDWQILAVAIMYNHFHVVIAVTEDPDPGKILGDLKSWGSRKLNARFGVPQSKTWWTERGSTRKLNNEAAIIATIQYVLNKQHGPLLTWSPTTGLYFRKPPGS
jgi:REP element-mobilizing transposase RayT